MKRIFRKLKRVNPIARNLFKVVLLGYIISYLFFAKSVIELAGIETVTRYILLLVFLGYFLFYFYMGVSRMLAKKYGVYYLLSLLSIILIILFSFGAHFIDLIYSKISNINEKDRLTYTSYLVSLNGTTLSDDSIIGMIKDEESIEGYILANDIIKENNLKQKVKYYENGKYDPFIEMLYDLYDKKVDAIFVSSNYVTLYASEEGFENIATETKVLYKASKEFDNKDTLNSSNKSLSEPFTVLIMGVDSEYNGLNANAAFNGDTLILATFNPKTLSATLLSIPRDTYVPIACRNNNYAKINSSAAYGTNCVIDTVKQFTGIDIDYFVKINFKGVVDLVEAVGGVTVDVEQPTYASNFGVDCKGMVCEQNSDRKWGPYTVFVPVGTQTLNGEQALAYARCRHLYAESDLARNRHQQDIIMALAKKMLKVGSYNDFKKVLDAISNNIATNMSTNQILSSYNILKDMVLKAIKDEDFINIEKTKLEVYSLPVYLPSGMRTSALGYYQDSLEEITDAMKINLGQKSPEYIKTFSYSLNEEYESKVVGAGARSGTSSSLLDNFVGKSKTSAQEYCDSKNLSCTFTYIDENSNYYNPSIGIDLIAAQTPHEGTLMKNVSSVTFYINGATSKSNSNTNNSVNTNTNNNQTVTPSRDTNEDTRQTPQEEKPDDTEVQSKPENEEVDPIIEDIIED